CASVVAGSTATAETYALSLHDALPIFFRRFQPQSCRTCAQHVQHDLLLDVAPLAGSRRHAHHQVDLAGSGHLDGDARLDVRDVEDRKSTRLNSSHVKIS